ncbi:MAG: RagB/SusD family nutrient uptake outer membrane protein [Bacteroidia bacterium]|nr:RagB/SusD family nutrient uptake outer membrane protein [Bacteroidia bacterium]
MKKVIIYTLAAVAILVTACNKFLTTDSPSAFTDTYIFANETDAQKAVMSVYALFNQDAFTSRISNVFTGNSDIECGAPSAAPDNSRRDVWSLEAKLSPSFVDFKTIWNNTYNAINRANECIEGIKASPISQNPGMKQLLGEAVTLRAYWYYILQNFFADVPYKTTGTKAGDEFYLPRMDRDTILTNSINDLIKIEPDMMWADQLTGGIERINREFVIGMISRLALTRAGYSMRVDGTMQRKSDYADYYKIARDYAKKLMDLKDRPLNPNFMTIFMNECKNVTPVNDDVLYEVAFQAGFGDVAWNHGIRVDAGTHSYGAGSAYLCLPITYMYSFDKADKRFPVTCSIIYYDKDLKQQPTGPMGISPGKWCRLWLTTPPGASSAKGTGINWPMMRYSDVLLMFAEADNELNGPTADAKAALQRVRQRAFDSSDWPVKVTNYISTVSASKASFFNAIVDERAWEFGGECMRKFDLIRWNLYGKKIADVRSKLTQMGIDANKGTGIYSTLPNYLYYKVNADFTLSFYDFWSKPAVAPPVKDYPSIGDNPTGYSRTSWALSMINTTTLEPATYVTYMYRGYTDNSGVAPAPYVLPIQSEIIISSLGILTNDGYGLK